MPMERGRIPRGPSCEMKTRGVGSVAPDCHRVAEGHGGPLGGRGAKRTVTCTSVPGRRPLSRPRLSTYLEGSETTLSATVLTLT